jgi:O-acetyl-ADP-ribose deacetylase (regulator of RNase III)
VKIFEHSNVLDTGAGFIVQSCNCKGQMGSGIAKEIRSRFPHVYDVYRARYEERGWNLGQIQTVKVDEDKFIINLMGQEFYGGPSIRWTSYDALAIGFSKVNQEVLEYNEVNGKILTVRFPLIGAGLGGGKWEIVEAIIKTELHPSIPTELHLYP